MTSRDEILASVRRHLPEAVALPELSGPWIEYPDVQAQFASVLEMIGGRCIRVPSIEAINEELSKIPSYITAKQVVSRVAGAGRPTVDLDAINDPHELENIDFAIVPGQFGVAENAAVWVNDDGIRHRVIFFLCQHLAFVIPAKDVIHNMSQAYERLSFESPRFGAFIAGPSKTADVEQSLVIGAHGARSLTVFIVE